MTKISATHKKEFKNSEYGIQLPQRKRCQGLMQKLKGCHVTTPKSQGVDFKFEGSKRAKKPSKMNKLVNDKLNPQIN
jgi:hypothetical protein